MKDGQKAKEIWFPVPDGNEYCIKAKDDTTLEFFDEYMGDHSEHYILEKKSGVEIARHNMRFIITVKWETP